MATAAKTRKPKPPREPEEPTRRPLSDAVINLRLSRRLRDTIDDAASSLGKTRTEFILDSVRKDAIDTLLDRRVFVLGNDQYAAFVRALEAPPVPNEKLKNLLRRKPQWEK
jgi:uncharacterized protein (DUF1778 family)